MYGLIEMIKDEELNYEAIQAKIVDKIDLNETCYWSLSPLAALLDTSTIRTNSSEKLVKVLELLLEHGANPNECVSFGPSLLDLMLFEYNKYKQVDPVAKNKYFNIISVMLSHGAYDRQIDSKFLKSFC